MIDNSGPCWPVKFFPLLCLQLELHCKKLLFIFKLLMILQNCRKILIYYKISLDAANHGCISRAVRTHHYHDKFATNTRGMSWSRCVVSSWRWIKIFKTISFQTDALFFGYLFWAHFEIRRSLWNRPLLHLCVHTWTVVVRFLGESIFIDGVVIFEPGSTGLLNSKNTPLLTFFEVRPVKVSELRKQIF